VGYSPGLPKKGAPKKVLWACSFSTIIAKQFKKNDFDIIYFKIHNIHIKLKNKIHVALVYVRLIKKTDL